MMKNLLERIRALWPSRPDVSNEEATETALLVFPKCC